jgi:hypothetical protein
MTEPMISLMAGIVVVLCIAVVLITHRRTQERGAPKARWLDTHFPHDWLRHRH